MPLARKPWLDRSVAGVALVLLSACSVQVAGEPSDATPSTCPTPDRIESYESFSERADCYASHHVGIPQHTDLNEINALLGDEAVGASDKEAVVLNSGVMSICISLLGGGEKSRVAERAQTWLATDDKTPLPLNISRAVVDLVSSQAWCKLVANKSR